MYARGKSNKTPYTLYTSGAIVREGEYYQLISIDPGTKNLAIRIERWYKTGKIVPIVFTKQKFVKKGDINLINVEVIEFFNQFKEFYPETHHVIIERQLPINYKMVRLSQHILTYFLMTCPNATIFEVNNKLKKILGAPAKISEIDLKEWSVQRAKIICTERNDEFSLKTLIYYENNDKADDLADTITQSQALYQTLKLFT